MAAKNRKPAKKASGAKKPGPQKPEAKKSLPPAKPAAVGKPPVAIRRESADGGEEE